MSRIKFSTSRFLTIPAFALALSLTGMLGCSTTSGNEPSTAKVPTIEDTGEDVSPKGKKWEGWRWKGDRDNCIFIVKNQCFAEQQPACAAAECEEDACIVEDGAPAKVSCKQ